MDYHKALQVLGVSDPPSPLEVKKAFRLLAIRYHPDKNPDNPKALARFQECTAAYSALLENFDKWHFEPKTQEGVKQTVSTKTVSLADLDDVFDDIFGFTREDRILGIQHPQDLEVTLCELAHGAEKKARLTAFEKCSACKGNGAAPNSMAVICTHCFGAGRIITGKTEGAGYKTCPRCEGRGRKVRQPCSLCDGFGRLKKWRKLNLQIPVGLHPAKVYTLHSTDLKSKKKYDLFIRLNLKGDPLFAVELPHLLCKYPINQKVADDGGEIEMPTLWGWTRFTVPPHSKTGDILCLSGYGLWADASQHKRGNLKVVLNVISTREARLASKIFFKKISAGNRCFKRASGSWWKRFLGW